MVYNDIGQLTEQHFPDGKERYIDYDVTGKVTAVYNDADKKDPLVQFTYDDRGFRLMKRVGDTEEWYVRDASGQVMAIYRRKDPKPDLDQKELPIYGSGKLGMAFRNPDHYKYIYELTDHLGNVRALVTKLGLQATATMEFDPEPGTIDEHEAQFFDNLQTRHEDVVYNRTNQGKYGALTNPSRPLGPTTTLRVRAGDEVHLQAFAKFVLDPGFDPNALTGGLVGTITDGVNDAVVNVEGGALTSGVGNAFASGFISTLANDNAPKAYLQYILLDEDFGYVDSDQVAVSELENEWQELKRSTTIDQDGYLYAYLVNESTEQVYFDDFTFSLQGTRVIRQTDYYPFGAVAKVWNNSDQTQQEEYRYDYQGQYAEKDTVTGWNAFELRMYDPLIGRWLQVDPAREFDSPYIGMANNPLNGTDPDGADWFENQDGTIQWFDGNTSAGFSDEDGNSWMHVSASQNLLVANHNRKYTSDGVSEPLNTATFHLYDASVDHFNPISAIVGNTVPSDPTISGTLREGIYDAEFASRANYVARDIEDLAILLRDPVTKSFDGLPTTHSGGSKLTMGEVFIHMANNYARSLFDSNENAYSTGCQTTGCYDGSRAYHNAFFENINDGWKGQYYLRRTHRAFHTYGSGPVSR